MTFYKDLSYHAQHSEHAHHTAASSSFKSNHQNDILKHVAICIAWHWDKEIGHLTTRRLLGQHVSTMAHNATFLPTGFLLITSPGSR